MKTVKILGDDLNKVSDTSSVFRFSLVKDGVIQDVTGKTVSFTITNGFIVPQIYFWNAVAGNNVFLNSIKADLGNVPTDWTPAPEEKADDSKVVHRAGNETMQEEQQTVDAITASVLITDTHLKDSVSPLEIESITVVVNFGDGGNNYFGGQIVLTADDDGVNFTTSTDTIKSQAIAKAKRLIADSQI